MRVDSMNPVVSDPVSIPTGPAVAAAPSIAFCLARGVEPIRGYVLQERIGVGGYGEVWTRDRPRWPDQGRQVRLRPAG